jgi:Divergent InlB B-repeat domain
VRNQRLISSLLQCATLLLGLLGIAGVTSAALLNLTWEDRSDNENGFRIERRIGTSGSYQPLASVGSNVVTYTDLNLTNGTTYCYRVFAFNLAGNSNYSNESCGTTAAANFKVTVNRSGTGSGTIASSPTAINCGNDCSAAYVKNTIVTLVPVAAGGSIFAGWSGHADCSDGIITVNADINCTATFNLISAYTLTTKIVNAMISSGSAGGRIVSNPVGIDCGTDCTEVYAPGRVVTLTPIAAANSKFAGWTGDADCADGLVTMNSSKTCTAKFEIAVVTLSVSKQGKGKVASVSSGIDCGSVCSSTVTAGTTLSLRATADPGFIFSGWSGACAGTGNCSVTLSSNTTVRANFVNFSDKIGVYRPSTGEWFLDRNGSGTWEGCNVDVCAQLFTSADALPVAGDWNGSGTVKIGLFVRDSYQWLLDANGNGIWDGCETDICSQSFGQAIDVPVVGRWARADEDRMGVFRPAEKKWHLDLNGNETLDRCRKDQCPRFNIYQNGDVPIVGDWTGSGKTQLGLFRPSSGQWFLNRNPNRAWNGCKKDTCIGSFGISGDLPVAGDWSGTGTTKIGVFRPSSGEWFLDLNGNGLWDGPTLDLYVPEYGSAGDIPIIGKW